VKKSKQATKKQVVLALAQFTKKKPADHKVVKGALL